MFRGAYRLSGTGIIECLEIIDVWYNLKQFDGLTGLILTPPPTRFYDRSTPLLPAQTNQWCLDTWPKLAIWLSRKAYSCLRF